MIKKLSALVIALYAYGIGSLCYSQPSIPKAKISPDLPGDLRKEIEALYYSKPADRVNAVLRIGEMAEKAALAIPFLIAMLGDSAPLDSGPIPGMRTSPGREAATVLVNIGLPSLEPLIAALHDEEPTVRQRAAWALGEIKDPQAVKPLIAALRDDDSIVRMHASGGLNKITGQDFGEDASRWQRWWDECKMRQCLQLKLFIEMLRSSRNQ